MLIKVHDGSVAIVITLFSMVYYSRLGMQVHLYGDWIMYYGYPIKGTSASISIKHGA